MRTQRTKVVITKRFYTERSKVTTKGDDIMRLLVLREQAKKGPMEGAK